MPDLDLEPHEYTERGTKEPILHPRWKIGVIAIICVFLLALFGRFVYAPAAHGVLDWVETTALSTRH